MTMLAQFAAAAGGVLPAYIEDVFSTYMYTGNGSTQTITNGIDLAGKGGLVWFKPRNTGNNHNLIDSVRGINKFLLSNATNAEGTAGAVGLYGVTSFNSNGFTLGQPYTSSTNTTDTTQVAWTFRKQPKFFDVVTYTGDGSDPRNIAHNLGSVPGSMIIKCTSTGATDWFVYHRSLGNSQSLNLNQTGAAETGTQVWGTTTPTSTVFTVGNINSNTNGRTYVAYLFAHDAGGFGLSGNENVVSCGTYTGNGSATGPVVTLGYEPQWVMIKRSSAAGDWVMLDVMRGFSDSSDNELYANLSLAEGSGLNLATPLATGFQLQSSTGNLNASGQTYIYIAIRRGPMKVPTLGTSVFTPVTATPGGSAATVVTGITTDLVITTERSHSLSGQTFVIDRLRGSSSATANNLNTASTAAEAAGAGGITFSSPVNTSINDNLYPPSGITNPVVYWFFQRAPSFFDEVCYTGNGSTQTIAHNLTVVPQLIIGKNRTVAGNNWSVNFNFAPTTQSYAFLNQTVAGGNDIYANVGVFSASPTSTSMFLTNSGSMNASGSNIVAYLFATAPGVSKVGSYTGTGTTQAINCGFTAGARFVLIKRTDSTGDWYVWDSARGIVAGNDPYLLWNNGAPEVTGTDYVDTSATGFELTSTAPAAINASGGSYIFLAVA